MDNKQMAASGVSLPVLLTIIFAVLKLLGLLTWSWWWVFSPIWISFLIGLIIAVVFAIGLMFSHKD